MDVRVLGPLEVLADDGRVVVLPARQLRLLAALSVRVREACSVDWLIEAVWGGASPPARGAKALQVYVSRLRRALPEAPIRTNVSGYTLELGDESLDSARFERLLAEARTSAAEGNDRLALSLLDRGLSLWRGGAYGELAYEEFASAEAARLEELRVLAAEDHGEAALRLGRHAEVLPELRLLAGAQPLRERPHAQLMLALYRCGRHAEALELFTSLRSRLREELGLDPGAELRALQRRILEHDPVLAVAASTEDQPVLLPAAPNRLVGRERELRELAELLARDDTRLLVLAGAGGSGKTRLALEVARACAGSFANGAALVELAPLREPELVLTTIAGALGLREQPGDTLEMLRASLRGRELLLVLDNAEHLREASPSYVSLLAAAPRLKLLVTSRTVLHLTGERVYPVEPLAAHAATALFHERAQDAEPRLRAGPSYQVAIRRICERLDGLPLAIELAASRTRTLNPVELFDRLDQRLPLLTGGPRDLPARQQTLRATLDWSYALLDEDARRDLSGLAVFTGGFTLGAAEALTGTTPERLATLLDHSLIQRRADAAGSRYGMLETIREYALEQLEPGRRDSLMRRLAEYLVGLSDSVPDDGLPSRAAPSELLAAEFDNMRGAVSWALAAPEPELALRLATEFRWFGFARPGTFSERSRWLEQGLRAPGTVSPRTRARALDTAGRIALILGDFERSAQVAEESLRLYRELADDRAALEPLLVLGMATSSRGNLERAKALHEEALTLAHRFRDQQQVHRALRLLGEIELELGDLRRASDLLERCVAFARDVGEPAYLSSMLGGLADVALASLDLCKARALYRESISCVRNARLWPSPSIVSCVAGLAAVSTLAGETERAARLWSGVETIEREWGTPLTDPERERYGGIVSAPGREIPPLGVALGHVSADDVVRDALCAD